MNLAKIPIKLILSGILMIADMIRRRKRKEEEPKKPQDAGE